MIINADPESEISHPELERNRTISESETLLTRTLKITKIKNNPEHFWAKALRGGLGGQSPPREAGGFWAGAALGPLRKWAREGKVKTLRDKLQKMGPR